MTPFLAASLVLTAAFVGPAPAEGLQSALSGLSFLLGGWSGGNAKVAETGGTAGWS